MADQPDIEETIDDLLSAERDEDKDLTNTLARLFYGSMGYHVERGYDFQAAIHPTERAMFDQASVALCFFRQHFDLD